MYMHTLPDFKPLEKLFKDNGYNIEVDLSNSIVIQRSGDDNYFEYDQLPKKLQKALNKFAAANNLDN